MEYFLKFINRIGFWKKLQKNENKFWANEGGKNK